SDFRVTVKEMIRSTDKISLPEAELVVSAGRGMKGPENWGMIEELANILGAATACSKPVSDAGWRPHSEHVGQTGIAISPNLYVAVGISGAIQHLAGVSSSKVIVVVNKDPEAPFFKSADYALVLGEDKGKRRLPIVIGAFEAQAIAIELENMTPQRPLTHDLFKSFATAFNIEVEEVIIFNLLEGVFYAKLVCTDGEK